MQIIIDVFDQDYSEGKSIYDFNSEKNIGHVIDNCSSRMLNFSGTTEKQPKCKRNDGQIIRIPEVNEQGRAKHSAQDNREHTFPCANSSFDRS